MIRATRTVIAALLVAQLGCAGAASYQPRPSPRIAAVHVNERVYVRDGQRYEIGLFGGKGEELVAGNETATALMRKHRSKQIWSWSLFGLGLGIAIAGNALLWTEDANVFPVRGLAVSWLGIASMAAALAFSGSARHDFVNAVNIYNDSLEGPIAPGAFDALPPPPGGR
jgi:hypothetical protein